MNEHKCRSRISIQSASRVSSSYTEKRSCTWGVNTRTTYVGPTHVLGVFRLPVICMWSSKTIILSLFASHVYSPYLKLIDSKPIVNTNFIICRKLCLNPYSEHIKCMSNTNTRISSLAASHVNRLCHRLAVCQAINAYSLRWVKPFL